MGRWFNHSLIASWSGEGIKGNRWTTLYSIFNPLSFSLNTLWFSILFYHILALFHLVLSPTSSPITWLLLFWCQCYSFPSYRAMLAVLSHLQAPSPFSFPSLVHLFASNLKLRPCHQLYPTRCTWDQVDQWNQFWWPCTKSMMGIVTG